VKVLNPEEFRACKTSDTIVVFGSGWSINKIKDSQWEKIKEFNSIGFNWFCKHSFEPTFFLVREQANTRARKYKGEKPKHIFKYMNRYEKTCLIVADIRSTAPSSFNYARHLNEFAGRGVVLKDKKRTKIKNLKKNIFSFGILHGKLTLCNVFHLIVWFGYKKILFAGVDLYDSRYFWLGKDETRHTVKGKRKRANSKHAITAPTIRLVRSFRRFGIEMYSLNKKSLLCTKAKVPHIKI